MFLAPDCPYAYTKKDINLEYCRADMRCIYATEHLLENIRKDLNVYFNSIKKGEKP
jgi:hypothetical protein